MLSVHFSQLAEWVGASEQLGHCSQPLSRVVIDSRKLLAGDVFVCLPGARVDAHQFLPQVAAAGAACAIVTRPDRSLALPQIVVADAERALAQLAKHQFARFKGVVIGLTGSAGKTTTKEMIAAIMGVAGKPLVTPGNLNNQIGVPLTLLALTEQHDSAVIEMGASRLGDIAYLVDLVRPQVALVNNVEPAHIEGFGSLEAVAQGKFEIFAGLRQGGTAVINLDNDHTRAYSERLTHVRQLTFSLQQSADVTASKIRNAEGLQQFTLNIQGCEREIALAFYGRHNIGNALAAAACASAAGCSPEVIATGLNLACPYPGRLQRRPAMNDAVLIDDSYNANPASMRMAVDVLAEQAGRRIYVMGNMGELGPEAGKLHADIGRYARKQGIDALWTLGELAQLAAESYGEGAQHFSDWQQLAAHCAQQATANTVFLIKGSRSAGMDRIADALAVVENSQC